MSKTINKVSDIAVYLRLLRYVVPSWRWFVVSVVGYIMYSSAQALAADMLQFVVDSLGSVEPKPAGIVSSVMMGLFAQDGLSRNGIYLLIAASFLGIAVIRGVGFFLGNYYLSKVSLNLVHQLRCEVFEQILSLPSRTYDQASTGDLLAKLSYHVGQVTEAATSAVRIILQEGLVVILLLAYMLYMNWQLTCLFFLVMPIVGFIAFWIGKQFRRISRKIQQSVGDFTQVANEAISGYREVRLFEGRDYEQQRFNARSADNYAQALKLQFYSTIGSPVILFFVSLALAVLMYMALKVSEQGTAGQFVAFITAAAVITRPVRQLTQVLAVVQRGLAACDDLFAFLDSERERDTGSYSPERIEGLIEYKHVSFAYGASSGDALKDITFTVKPGKTLALVGFSGSGKSTVIGLLARFYDYSRGEILLDGRPLPDYRLTNLRRHIAIVTQNVTLFNDTIYNNVAYGDLANKPESEVIAALEAANAMEFINDMPQGLQTVIGQDGQSLSGGQRQRIAIARAILKDAAVLVLDEATSALDNRSELLIQRALDDVMKNRTSIVIAHRLSTIEAADEILVMEEGRILEAGTHASLIEANSRYRQLYEKRFEE